MSGAHSELSPSTAHRWMRCPGSVELCKGVAETSSPAADEGSLAHEIAALCLAGGTNAAGHPASKDLPEEALPALQSYLDYVRERHDAQRDWLMVEQQVDLSRWLGEDNFGTADAVIYRPRGSTLHVIDLKFGKGNLVFANLPGEQPELNPQLALYGLGALHKLEAIDDLKEIELTIMQPRREHVSTVVLARTELLAFGEAITAAARRVREHPELIVPGEAQCKWCPVRATCDARTRWHLDAFSREVALLQPGEVSQLLGQLGDMRAWCDDLERHALASLLADAKSIPEWKVVEGRSVRQWTAGAAELLTAAGVDPFDREPRMLGLTVVEKMLGKKAATEIMPKITVKTTGKPTLARSSDPRPPLPDTLAGLPEEAVDTGEL